MTTKKRSDPDLAPATISEHDGVRYLHLGTPWVQGAMRLKQPTQLELEYVQRMMAWMLLRPADEVTRGHAVQLGLGAGSITRFTHGALKMKTTAVELNPTVIGVCRAYFRLPAEGPRCRVVEMDAQRYLDEVAEPGSADVLCVDLYDHEAASPVLDSEDFYRGCARLLADQGVMSVNLFGRHASFARSAQRIDAAFAGGTVVSLQPTREGNTVVLAIKHGDLPEREELARRAQQIETRWGLPARKWLRMIRPLPGAPTATA
ncbi:methyltransferase domain-containing protein [uncultured Piscinibacter sp.]|uniref:spermine/spermidine synthase domain-containing protein n=1 Tax=uncultured Piscinibacter sp. TaxID=1131835 RepID=UPI0026114AC4|nr:methyltransferase domain-containing protein [uncultured Piscinibacter sp.]